MMTTSSGDQIRPSDLPPSPPSRPGMDGRNTVISGAIRRIRQACTHCRHRKTKCSGEKPRCNNCRRVGRTCQYEPYSQSRPSSASSASQSSTSPSARSLGTEATNPELLKRIKQIENQLALISDQSLADPMPLVMDQAVSMPYVLSPEEPGITSGSIIRDSLSPPQRRSSQTLPQKPQASNVARFSTLPPHSVVQSLVNTYFISVHNQPYSYFQEENFREKLGFGLLPKCLVFAVLASALRFSQDPYFKGSKQQATEAYAREAWLSVLNDHMTAENCPNLNVAQTTNILAIIDFTAGRTSSGWLKIGLAVRIAQDLELMKEPCCASLVDQEERRRIFWSIYLLDKLVSCGRSRPPALYDEDCQVQLPCDETQFRLGQLQKTATLYQVSNWTADSDHIGGNFALTILAASALGRCARYVLHQRVADEMAPWDQRSEFAAINTYLLLVGHHLRIDSTSIDDIVQASKRADGSLDTDACHLIFAYAVFHLCFCLLNHLILLRLRLQKLSYRVPPNFQARCLQTSTEHASMVIELLHRATAAGFPIQASFYAYITTLTGSIIMMAIQSQKQIGSVPAAKLQENRQQALSILERMGHLWEHASKMHVQLLLFDASDVASFMNLDSSSPEISEGLEEVLWPIVDYGLMCTRIGGGSSSDSSKPLQESVFEDQDGSCFPHVDFDEVIGSAEGFLGFGTEADHLTNPAFSMTNIECSL